MEVSYRVVLCERSHVDVMAAEMPPIQRREIAIWTDIDVQTALRFQLDHSHTAWCALFDDKPAAVWGVAGRLIDRQWGGWLVTNELFRAMQPLGLVRAARRELARVAEGRMVVALCPDFYPSSIRFLEMIGFLREESVTAPAGENCQWLRYYGSGA